MSVTDEKYLTVPFVPMMLGIVDTGAWTVIITWYTGSVNRDEKKARLRTYNRAEQGHQGSFSSIKLFL